MHCIYINSLIGCNTFKIQNILLGLIWLLYIYIYIIVQFSFDHNSEIFSVTSGVSTFTIKWQCKKKPWSFNKILKINGKDVSNTVRYLLTMNF